MYVLSEYFSRRCYQHGCQRLREGAVCVHNCYFLKTSETELALAERFAAWMLHSTDIASLWKVIWYWYPYFKFDTSIGKQKCSWRNWVFWKYQQKSFEKKKFFIENKHMFVRFNKLAINSRHNEVGLLLFTEDQTSTSYHVDNTLPVYNTGSPPSEWQTICFYQVNVTLTHGKNKIGGQKSCLGVILLWIWSRLFADWWV